jgi:SPP1 family phage portal protein
MIYQVVADSLEINKKNVKDWVEDFIQNIMPERKKFAEYYDGKNCIIKQGAVKGRPNYSINVNMAKYIIDVSTAYAFGLPIKYTTDETTAEKILERIKYINKNCDAQEIDFQQGGDMATYGVSYQLVMAIDQKGAIEDRVIFKHLEPTQTFYVVDNTILKNPVCAIYFYDYKEKDIQKRKIYVYDTEDLTIYDDASGVLTEESKDPHNMGLIPIIQSLNNDDAFSDIQCVTDLLDSLSLAVSNSTDNLQSIANAILAVTGGKLTEENIDLLNKTKVGNLPQGCKMEWVIKNVNPEAEKQQIENNLKFLFQISQVPDLTDEAFAGNQSGVAMQYKLWGLDQLWATKTTKYRKSIVYRNKILLHLMQYQFKNHVEMLDKIKITFDKNLPKDNSAEYTMVQALKDVVSKKTLLENISIVDDVEAELEALDEEAAKTADLYGFDNNSNLNNGGADAEEEQ